MTRPAAVLPNPHTRAAVRAGTHLPALSHAQPVASLLPLPLSTLASFLLLSSFLPLLLLSPFIPPLSSWQGIPLTEDVLIKVGIPLPGRTTPSQAKGGSAARSTSKSSRLLSTAYRPP